MSAPKKPANWLPPGTQFARVPLVMMRDSRLTPRHRDVMLVVLGHANLEGQCCLTCATIAEYTGHTEETVSRVTGQLVDFGWLKKARTGYNRANRYTVMLPGIPADKLRAITDKRLSDEEYQRRYIEKNGADLDAFAATKAAERAEKAKVEREREQAERDAPMLAERERRLAERQKARAMGGEYQPRHTPKAAFDEEPDDRCTHPDDEVDDYY